ncbi:NUDIX domain-containing protein [Saccharibacillus kuerlensis]|uniref:NUDIX hydrolase n=1 Tax=Saccharibacillus kuerlensis TaxID=459527 RepID=A0ABQ2L8P9_9BACL|nr:NUDIX domain-containing protein [Saccharibacillus kuerlensis]GGO06620.1 NUDIX hydrolase [Saccharibacillus kuerlensis]
MKLIQQFIHRDVSSLEGRTFERKAARAVIMRGSDILLIYTKRYNDYSFPGGGLEADEDEYAGLCREVTEETGAVDVEIVSELGYIEEYRPHYKDNYDLIHMLSYYYVCSIGEHLGEASPEDYEIANGSSAVWVDLNEAIRYNRRVIADQEASMGFSIERETLVLELLASPANLPV